MSASQPLKAALQIIDSQTLGQYQSVWRQLFDRAVEMPVTISPMLAIPWLKALARESNVFALQGWRGESLTGLFLLGQQRWRWGYPGKVLHTWQTPLTFSGTPLLDHQTAVDEMAGLFSVADAPLLLQALPCSGYFWEHLAEAAARANTPLAVISTWERAVLKAQDSYDAWFTNNFDRKRRKEYRRMRNRLGEIGHLESRCWSSGEPVQAWTDTFLALEAKGWKGKRGTALASEAKGAACVTEAIKTFANLQALRFWSLTLNGETIATLFAFVCADKAWLAKIAYDEAYAKYSPGVLLMLDATENLLNDKTIKLTDSCAIPNHPMINTIWRDRIVMADVLIGTSGLALWRFRLMVKAELLRRHLREMAKSVFYYLTNRHRS